MADRDFRVKNGLHVSSNAFIANSITSVNSVQFNVGANIAPAVGRLEWSFEESTLEIGLNSQVNLQVGQETVIRGLNSTGSTINNGTLVMLSPTQGTSGVINITPAVANGSVASKNILGLTTQNIATASVGFVTTLGKVRGLNTSSFAVGDELYANPTVVGGLSNTKPIAPNVKVQVGTVLASNATNGIILVRPNYGSSIEENENVFIQNPLNRQPLVWSANNRFENSSFNLADLDDVVYGTPNDGALLSYSSGVWTDTNQVFVATVAATEFAYLDLDANQYVSIKAPNTVPTTYTLTLPATPGTNGQAIITDGAGNLSFSTISGGGGGGITTGRAIAMAIVFG